jgi:hypothetical protein
MLPHRQHRVKKDNEGHPRCAVVSDYWLDPLRSPRIAKRSIELSELYSQTHQFDVQPHGAIHSSGVEGPYEKLKVELTASVVLGTTAVAMMNSAEARRFRHVVVYDDYLVSEASCS